MHGLAISLAYFSGEEGDILPFSNNFYLPVRRLERGEGQHPVVLYVPRIKFFFLLMRPALSP
jgi:hypothetical protein